MTGQPPGQGAPAARPFSETVGPAHQSGHPGSSVAVSVADSGAEPIAVRVTGTELVRRGSTCALSPVPVRWLKARPDTFTVAAGHSRSVSVRIAPVNVSGTSGHHTAAIVAMASQKVSGPGGHVSGAVASMLSVRYPGPEVATACTRLALPPPPHIRPAGHSYIWLALALGVGLLAICAGCVLWLRRTRGAHQ